MNDPHKPHDPEHHLQGKGTIFGHPIHPMLVDFPIVFLIAVLFSDVLFAASGEFFWAQLSLYGLGAGILMGTLAAVFGLLDFLTVPKAREHLAGWAHLIGNVIAMLIAIINFWLRLGNIEGGVVPYGLILSAGTGLLLVITGWFGGSLVYRHRIGTTDH